MLESPILAAIADERRRIADLVASLSPAQLGVPSLCGDWTVRQVAGHLLAAVAAPPSALLKALVRSGFRLHLANSRLAVETAARPAAEIAEALRRNAGKHVRPPIVGFPGQLTDLQVHGQDMRRPLGLPHGLAPDRLRASLDFLTGGRAVGFTPRRRTAGLRFTATDLDWTWGSGPLVAGPAEALMLALTGRPVALSDLDGPGVRVLAGRLA
ncbi:MAG: maleylpyruvate isomerase family mycothiol-dependent enzyme [Actinoplanes sp.]